uniref:TNP2-like transposon protein n=1 Tax=Solanum tuberosum TaxID=4113 RepID=M1D484_SOLTU
MRAALLWTINDFPAYANLSRWSTKGALACPLCNKDTPSTRLRYGRKFSYMGARRFLSSNHTWWSNKRDFYGKVERRSAPEILSGKDVLNQLLTLEDMKFGKTPKKRKYKKSKGIHNWRNKSIFFKLPYWKNNLIRHNLDVMHIEKNVCDNIIGTLLDIEGKTKDNLNARHDLKEMGIRSELHPTQRDGRWCYPAACYSLSADEKSKVCKFLKMIKVPNGYSSNISRWVKSEDRKIYGLKSHDSHILLEQLLPLAIRGVVPNNVYDAITELSIFFRELCSKTLRVDVLDQLATQIPITLSKLEKIFLPAFFDVMVHLVIHLPREAKLGGPVQYRWMYPIERFLRTLKCYVRNRNQPEGSIIEGYIVEESIIFCSRYLPGNVKGYDRMDKNYEDDHIKTYSGLSVFERKGSPLLRDASRNLEELERKQAHLYVLRNCEEVQPFLRYVFYCIR